jgi:hypothetical protein
MFDIREIVLWNFDQLPIQIYLYRNSYEFRYGRWLRAVRWLFIRDADRLSAFPGWGRWVGC